MKDCQPGFVKRSKAWSKLDVQAFSKQGIEKLIRNAVMNILGHTENHGVSSFPFDIYRAGTMGSAIRKNMYDVLRFRTTFEKGEPEDVKADFDCMESLIHSLRDLLKGQDKLWTLQVSELLIRFKACFK